MQLGFLEVLGFLVEVLPVGARVPRSFRVPIVEVLPVGARVPRDEVLPVGARVPR